MVERRRRLLCCKEMYLIIVLLLGVLTQESLVYSFSTNIPKSIIHRSSAASKTRVNGFDPSFITDGIHALDSLLQGALNQATSTTPVLPDLLTAESNVALIEEPGGALNPLGNDLLIFLCATIGIVPLFKWLKASPVIGFLAAGLLMGPAGLKLFTDLNDMEALADFGVLFLLFEQGLELTVDRLKSLSKFAFGMGTLQVILCTAAFFVFPFVGGVQFLEFFFQSDSALVDITRVDEALVIGAALSLSSSAFVLKILQEKGQLTTKFGSASLGILLLQDIAVVPLLVLLPIIESQAGPMPLSEQLILLGETFLKAILGLGSILVIGGRFVRFLFSLVAQTRSSETFVALCLLVALGTGALTDQLGLSSTLGAFTAGTLLAESNYRTQIESDIKPFRGLLLGLFFLTTGASVDPFVIKEQFPTVIALLGGLITFKSVIISLLGPYFGLSKAESVRTGLLLSGGGEFAFVVLTLADKLNVLPGQLVKILVGVVVMSMAITPALSGVADKAADFIEDYERKNAATAAMDMTFATALSPRSSSGSNSEEGDNSISEGGGHSSGSGGGGHESYSDSDVVVICGFGTFGETVAKFLTASVEKDMSYHRKERALTYVAFDLDPERVSSGYKAGRSVLYGDGSQPKVLSTAGIEAPIAFVVTYEDEETALKSVERLHIEYPSVPIFTRAPDTRISYELIEAGAARAVSDQRESSLYMSSLLMKELGYASDQVKTLTGDIRRDLEQAEKIELMSMQAKKSGTVMQSTEMVMSPDDYYKSLVSMFSGKRKEIIDGASRRFKGVFDTTKANWLSDTERRALRWGQDAEEDIDESSIAGGGSKTTTATVPAEVELSVSQAEAELDDLGVTICVLPAKKGTKESIDK